MARVTVPGSGFWSTLVALINGMFTEVYQAIRFGVYDYNDLATATTPVSITGGGGYVDIPNDGAGANTNLTYALPGIANIWNTATGVFDFSSLELGDAIDIRIHFTVTTTANNQEGTIQLLMGVGSASEFALPVLQQEIKSIGTYELTAHVPFYIGSADIRDYPAKFQMASPDNASVVVNGWYVKAEKRTKEVV